MLFLFVSFKQYAFHTRSVNIIPVDVMDPFALKCPLIFQHDPPDEIFHPFDHDQIAVSMPLDIPKVFPAEVSPVKDEAEILVSIAVRLIDHAGKLGHVVDAARVFLIKQRPTVCRIKSNGIVEDRRPLIHLGLSILDDIDVTRLRVLIRGIVRDIDPLSFAAGGLFQLFRKPRICSGFSACRKSDTLESVYTLIPGVKRVWLYA